MFGMDTVELYHGSNDLSTEPLDEPGLPNTNAHALFDRLRNGLLVQAAGKLGTSTHTSPRLTPTPLVAPTPLSLIFPCRWP
jgi:hypothetical protein